jgi:glycosyltransferase involved in cell wall biosynthesis
MSEPRLVSVVIPTRDRPGLLQEALGSLARQTYPHWEAIVVDDTASRRLPDRLAALSDEARVKIFDRTGEVAGAPVCRNQGVRSARGDYVIFLDDDDCLAPSCLEKRVHALEQRPELDFMVFPCAVFRKAPGDTRLLHNIRTGRDDLDRFLLLDTPWQTAGLLWRRSALDRVGVWDEALPSFQDWDFHVRALIGGLRYDWGGGPPDCFWRQPASRDATVGTRSQLPEHLRSHLELFTRATVAMRDAGLFDDHRRALLAGLFFWLAEAWLRTDDRAMALSVWCRCKELTGLQENVFDQGQAFLASPPRMLLRRALRKLLMHPYPLIFHSGDYSRTSRRCHYDTHGGRADAG